MFLHSKETVLAIEWNSTTGRRLRERLESDHLVWLTTVDMHGVPYPSLVWFWWSGSEVLVYSRESLRVRNLERNAQVALNFNSDDRGGNVATLGGSAHVDRGHVPVTDHPSYLEKYRWRIEVHLRMTVVEFGERYPVPVLITPDRGQAW